MVPRRYIRQECVFSGEVSDKLLVRTGVERAGSVSGLWNAGEVDVVCQCVVSCFGGGNDSCHVLLDCVSTKCEEFREMKIVKYAKCIGTLIGPRGYFHRWTAPRKFIR